MASKAGETSRKRKGKAKASTSESWEMDRFLSRVHQDHFYEVVALKKVIPEVPFSLKKGEYPEIRHEIRRRGWEVLTNPIQQVGILMVQEFYANAWITKNHDQGVNPDPKNYLTMVRGKYLDFSPESVRVAFNLPMMQGDEHPYTRRVNFDQRLDQVLTTICEEGAQWKQDSRGKPVQLRRHDLKPVARGWLEFIQRSIIPTSNRSEVTIDRAIMIHSIMIGEEIEVHEVIAQELYRVADKTSTLARLAFPHLICHLCYSVGVDIEGDITIDEDKPITKKRMEYTRDPTHHEIPEIPQGMNFPPQDYWGQLNTSLGELSSNMGQLRVEHQEHSILLHEIREEQRIMREEQQRQGRDIEELKHSIGPSKARKSRHH
ncbi:uncharacterized protein LOC130967343 [Arachis stenosperma]|uniref:uncharacterized protein LOC130967343 n=1 Tax=Arachis stenosperma TaxID=217475 RepID=UPI0025AC721C|nr:uncharacterized protein LOC130967343 [Arachis stenosperma]XP_057748139.1 uncharacterized protein LOC130967343 [Arachis stenosperma]